MVRGRGQEGLALHTGPPHRAKSGRSLAVGTTPRERKELTASSAPTQPQPQPQSTGRSHTPWAGLISTDKSLPGGIFRTYFSPSTCVYPGAGRPQGWPGTRKPVHPCLVLGLQAVVLPSLWVSSSPWVGHESVLFPTLRMHWSLMLQKTKCEQAPGKAEWFLTSRLVRALMPVLRK